MKKHDALFSAAIIISAVLFGAVVTDSVLDSWEENCPASAMSPAVSSPAPAADDQAQTAALQKKFEKMGLKLQEGKYWQGVQ